jgi:hypothetical protein
MYRIAFIGFIANADSTLSQLVKNRLSDNAGAVNHFLSVLLRALRRARHFALVEAVAFAVALAPPTKARS